MARISVRQIDRKHCVVVSGRLMGADLRRLEHACGPALERKHVDLELILTGVVAMDSVAHAFIQKLLARGAVIVKECRRPRGVDDTEADG